MVGSKDGLPSHAESGGETGSEATSGLSDQECVERLRAAIAEHDGASPAGRRPGPVREGEDSSDTVQLGEVAALIGRLAVPPDD